MPARNRQSVNWWQGWSPGNIIIARRGTPTDPAQFQAWRQDWEATLASGGNPELIAQDRFLRSTFGDRFANELWQPVIGREAGLPTRNRNYASVQEAEAEIQRIRNQLRQPVEFEGGRITLSTAPIDTFGIWQRQDDGSWKLVGGPMFSGETQQTSTIPAAVTAESTRTGAEDEPGEGQVVRPSGGNQTTTAESKSKRKRRRRTILLGGESVQGVARSRSLLT
jgi:hypothetical protein